MVNLDKDKIIASGELVSAFLSAQSLQTSQLELTQRACDALSRFGKGLEKISPYQPEYLRSVSFALDDTSKIFQHISQSLNATALVRHIADIISQQNFQITADLTKAINISFSECLSSIDTLFQSDESIGRCISALEKATPYMPDDVNQEIKETVIEPAKKKQLSIDTLISIIALVLTILFFVFEQAAGYVSQQESNAESDALCKSNQQLSDEIDELSRVIQQLTDEVSELRHHLDSSGEISLDDDDSDCQKSEVDRLDQIDNSQQPDSAL